MSRPRFSLFILFLCRDLKIYVTTSKYLFILKYVSTLTLLVATRLVHPLSTLCRDLVFLSCPKLLLQHLFGLNKLFHVAKVSVATVEGSIATNILPSVQHYVATQTILFPYDLHMFFPFFVATYCLLSRPSSIVNNQIMVLRHRKCCCDTISLVIAWKFAATHKFQSRHKLLQLLFFSSFLPEISPFLINSFKTQSL